MDVVRGCIQCDIIERRGYVPGKDHSVCSVVYRPSFAHLLGDLEVVISVRKNNCGFSSIICRH